MAGLHSYSGAATHIAASLMASLRPFFCGLAFNSTCSILYVTSVAYPYSFCVLAGHARLQSQSYQCFSRATFLCKKTLFPMHRPKEKVVFPRKVALEETLSLTHLLHALRAGLQLQRPGPTHELGRLGNNTCSTHTTDLSLSMQAIQMSGLGLGPWRQNVRKTRV